MATARRRWRTIRRCGLAAVVLGLAVPLIMSACSQPGAVSGGTDSTAAFSEKWLFRTTATERLLAIRARMDSLERELPPAQSAVNATMRARAAALGAQRDSLSARVRDATEDEWQSIRLRVADVLDSLEVRIDRLSDDLRRSARHT